MRIIGAMKMDKQRAQELLSFHSGANPDFNNPKWTNGFLGMLRPFTGVLYETNFYEIMKCLEVLSFDFQSREIKQETIGYLWSICHFSRAWALHEEGMLQRNNLLTREQIQVLDDWVDIISYAVMNLLEGNIEEAFSEYKYYLQENNRIGAVCLL